MINNSKSKNKSFNTSFFFGFIKSKDSITQKETNRGDGFSSICSTKKRLWCEERGATLYATTSSKNCSFVDEFH